MTGKELDLIREAMAITIADRRGMMASDSRASDDDIAEKFERTLDVADVLLDEVADEIFQLDERAEIAQIKIHDAIVDWLMEKI